MAEPNGWTLVAPAPTGNVDLYAQPKVKNPDGSVSTVDSSSYNIDGKEVLLPSVTPDGRHLHSAADIVAEYRKTGRYLGKFDTADQANAYATQLHNDYAAGKYDKRPEPAAGWTLVEKAPPAHDPTLSDKIDAALMDNPIAGPMGRAAQGLLRMVKAHPVEAGATAGAVLAPLTGGASIPAAMAAAGLGAAGGAGVGIGARQLMTGKPEAAGDTARTMATEGAMGVAGEGAGQAIGAGLKMLGRGAYRVALAPEQRVLRKYGDVVGEGLSTGTPVDKGGLAQAVESKATRIAGKRAALQAADKNVSFTADAIANDASQPLSDYAAKQVRAGLPDPTGKISDRLAQFKAANPDGSLTPSSLDAIKGTLDDNSGGAYRKIRMREAVTPREKTTMEMAQAMSRANEGAVPQYKEMNRGIMDAEGLRNSIERRTIGSGGNQVLDTLLTLLHGGSAIPGRVAMMPPVLSRFGIASHAVGQSGAVPMGLKAALIAAMGGSPDAPEQ